MSTGLIHEALTRSVIGGFFEVHKIAGFGFLEQYYARALEKELTLRGHCVKREVEVALTYKGDIMGHHRLDMVVDDILIIEIKAKENLHRDAHRQLLSYLRATGMEVGLLFHFSPSGARFFRLVNSRGGGPSAASADSVRL